MTGVEAIVGPPGVDVLVCADLYDAAAMKFILREARTGDATATVGVDKMLPPPLKTVLDVQRVRVVVVNTPMGRKDMNGWMR
ncbi:hypothetical protein AAP_00571 [Ascosphaera apis ARSEF 7405]|uniref:Uncharacterized protein n=1 Tax=Ascosphaera apis ARSEF 7405 TaxID=392613 RepID=A0A168CRN8_9EURO|nr:hypothetical protein AAP_00571 [Ascosphaera apis ARSEF 7405]